MAPPQMPGMMPMMPMIPMQQLKEMTLEQQNIYNQQVIIQQQVAIQQYHQQLMQMYLMNQNNGQNVPMQMPMMPGQPAPNAT
jgi:hypothetical protein